MDTELYLFLSSEDSLQFFPFNTNTNFTSRLPQRLTLPGLWHVSLIQLQLPTLANTEANDIRSIDILCDLVDHSTADGQKKPILRRVPKGIENHEFVNPLYLPINQHDIDRVHIRIRGNNNTTLSFESQPTSCTLHLRRII